MKRIAFILFTILLPIIGLFLLEGALRIFIPGKPPEMIRELGKVDGQSFMLFDRVGPASFFGPQAHRMSPSEIVGFYMPKPTNTVRVILTGESAMRGFPQPTAFTAASILREMLRDDYPNKRIEVLNFSATAVASYPVMKITEAALACDPDVIVTMAGHNEYFGAYGVIATRHLGSNAAFYDLDYKLRHTAIGRLIGRTVKFFKKNEGDGKQLMELMAGADSIPHGDKIRTRAHENFTYHLNRIANACKSAGVPLILCVPPSNETGLSPIGPDDKSGSVDGRTARESFDAARAIQKTGSFDDVEKLFIDARDRDAMPWRASSTLQIQIKKTVEHTGTILCDVDRAFREYSGDEGIGWNLMDDHVHPNIDGQALLADTIRKSVWEVFDTTFVRTVVEKDYKNYLDQLGDNLYDRLSVATTMHKLFEISFLADSNPDARDLFARKSQELFDQIPREVHDAIKRWQQLPTLSIGMRPLSGLAAMEWLRKGKPLEAIPLFRTALKSVPPYSSWSIEYTYFLLVSVKTVTGELREDDIHIAEAALSRGEILITLGDSPSGQSERFMGRILQVLNKHDEAVPYLEKARGKLKGMDRVANDRALIEALRELGRKDEAGKIIDEAVKANPAYAPYYR